MGKCHVLPTSFLLGMLFFLSSPILCLPGGFHPKEGLGSGGRREGRRVSEPLAGSATSSC